MKGAWGENAAAEWLVSRGWHILERNYRTRFGELDIIAEKAKNCDILLHEVEYAAGIAAREPKWQKYHREVHTLSTDLAEVAKKAQPKLLVTYHRIYHMNIQDNAIDVEAETRRRSDLILQEIRDAGYTGKVVNGEDLDVFNA